MLRGELEAIEDGVHSFDRSSLMSLQNEVAMLNKLIEDLYELSLSDVGALSYKKVPADIAQLVRGTVDVMRESFKAKQIALSLALPESSADHETDTTFQVDPGRFVQLLKNLLQNSLRYTDPGGNVRVSLTVGTSGWQLDVQDSVPGVPPEALPHLFDRLYRVDESRSRQSGGAGLVSRGDGGLVNGMDDLTRALIVREEKEAIFPDRAPEGAAELVAKKDRLLRGAGERV